MARVVIVPGLSVRRYLRPSADALRRAGHQVLLCPPLGWPTTGTQVRPYGEQLAGAIANWGPVDLLIGSSVGTQGAVAAVQAGADVSQLLLSGPTIDPDRRRLRPLLRVWLSGENHPDAPSARVHARDWVIGGPTRIVQGLRSAIDFRLEDELPGLRKQVTIAHGDRDRLSPLPFAADLADRSGAALLIMPNAPHSWPASDGPRLVELVDELITSSDRRACEPPAAAR